MPLLCVAARYGSTRRELGGDDDAVARLLARVAAARELLDGNLAARAHDRAIGEVRQDAQEHFAARDRLDERRDAFAHAVDEIRAHRVARVDEQVHDEHLLRARRQRMHEQLDVACAAAARDHVRVQAVGEVDDLLLAIAQRLLRLLHVRQIHDLNLADQDRIRRFGAEAAAARGSACTRSPSAAITDGSSTTIGTMYCLSLTTRFMPSPSGMPMTPTTFSIILSAESSSSVCLPRRERAEVGRIDEAALVDDADALFDAELVELGNSQAVVGHGSSLPCSRRCHYQAVLGQRDIDHSKTSIYATDFVNAASASASAAHARPKIAATGAADLVTPRRAAAPRRRSPDARP